MGFRREVSTVEHFPLFFVVTAAGCCWWEDIEVEGPPIPSIRILYSMQVGFGWVLVGFFLLFVHVCVCNLFPGGEFPWSSAWGWSDTCWQSRKTFPKPEGSRLRMYLNYFPSLEWRFLTVSLQCFRNQLFRKCRRMRPPPYQQVAFKKCSM